MVSVQKAQCKELMIRHSFKKRKKVLPVITTGSVWVSRPILLQQSEVPTELIPKSLQNPEHPSLRTGMLFCLAEFSLPARIHFYGTETQTNWWKHLLVEHQLISGYLQTLYSSGCININGLKCFLLPARTWCPTWWNIRKAWMLRHERKVHEVRTVPQARGRKDQGTTKPFMAYFHWGGFSPECHRSSRAPVLCLTQIQTGSSGGNNI